MAASPDPSVWQTVREWGAWILASLISLFTIGTSIRAPFKEALDRIEGKVDKLDEKLDGIAGRVTALETKDAVRHERPVPSEYSRSAQLPVRG